MGGQLEVTRQCTSASGSGDGGGLGGDSSWGAGAGYGGDVGERRRRAAGREAQTPRLVGACERQARALGGGRCAPACWPAVKAPPKNTQMLKKGF
jgi:hypothetical protein